MRISNTTEVLLLVIPVDHYISPQCSQPYFHIECETYNFYRMVQNVEVCEDFLRFLFKKLVYCRKLFSMSFTSIDNVLRWKFHVWYS